MNDFIQSPHPPSLSDPNPTGGAYHDAYGGPESLILASMKRARPWIMFLSVLGYILAGLIVLTGVGVIVAGAMSSETTRSLGPIGPGLGLVYIVMSAFYVVPSYLLGRYASSIGRYVDAGGPMEGLAEAVQKQTTFWRFIGISAAVLMGLYGVGLAGACVVGVVAAVARH